MDRRVPRSAAHLSTDASRPLGARLLPVADAAASPDWWKRIGVTRIARVTGLDRCGVEVACAIRPDGDILQVSNGKGRTFSEACRAAASEALELAAAERPDPSRLLLREEAHTAAFWHASFVTADPSLPASGGLQPWAKAERLDTSGDVLIPASLVWCPSNGVFTGVRGVPWTANGIAAHPDRRKARLHGLLELFEREALCRVFPEGWTPDHLRARGVRFEHPIAAHLASLGIVVHAVDATPTGWPVPVAAVLLADADTRAPRLAAGYACRTTAEEAFEAALFEACQSRLTDIHGAREDVTTHTEEIPDWLLAPARPRRPMARLPRWRGALRALLKATGVAAASVDMSMPGVPMAVERVFVPGFRISELVL
jgi:ribosomal protein S12 methylthiotransferase accessory factor